MFAFIDNPAGGALELSSVRQVQEIIPDAIKTRNASYNSASLRT